MRSIADALLIPSDRFVVRGQLGAGGMGVVYRVLDQNRGREVALKTLTGSSPRDLYRFKREFRALCDLAHPNLCALHELHTTGDEWFFTMELVHGISFLDWVRPSKVGSDQEAQHAARGRPAIVAAAVDFERLNDALGQLCDGVLALHVAGKLHRDLKPSNVLCEPGGRVVLLDFGLVAELERAGPDHTHTRMAVGTPSYMSPEQAADLPLGPASDWYSVGVILYEALTGRRPFDGNTAEVVMRRKQVELPPSPRELAPGTPDLLNELCRHLLNPNPVDRLHGRTVLAALGKTQSTATATIERTVAVGPFVGRGEHLAALEDARAEARHNGVAVIVRGASGMGKSSLVNHFLTRCGEGTLVLSGRCYQRDNVPYKTLDMLIDALTDALLELSPADRARVLPRDLVALTRLFPVLRRVPEMAEPRILPLLPHDPQELRQRAWNGLRKLLSQLASIREVVVFVDDLQWGDLDSTGFLTDLIARPDRPRFLLILAHRDEDADGPIVRELARRVAAAATTATVRMLTVAALPPDEAHELVDRLATAGGSRDVASIVREAAGHTMFLAELARAAERDVAPSLDELLAARIARLPRESRALLIACAVAARSIALEVAGRAAGTGDALGAAAALRFDRLIRSSPGPGEQIEPFHDRVRTAVLAGLSADSLRATHHSLALAYRAAEPLAHERFIDHLLGAGLEEEAAAAAASAAATAEHALAFQRAADLYAIALAHAAPTSSAARGLLLIARARVLANAGRLMEAATAYQEAIPSVVPEERLELERLRTEQTLRAGRLREGLLQARELLVKLGYRLPTTPRGSRMTLFGQRLALRLRGLRSNERPAEALPRADLIRVDVLWSVAAGLTFANPILGRVVQAWLLREALALGEASRLANALSLEISYLAGTGGPDARARVDQVAARARDIAVRRGDQFQVALADAQRGMAYFILGQFDESCQLLETSLAPLRDHLNGDRWQVDLSEIFFLAALFFSGRIRELVEHAPNFLADAIERGDVYSQHGIRSWRSNVAWLALDRPDEARRHVDEVVRERGDLGDFNVHEWYQLVAQTQIDLYQGDLGAARTRIEQARPQVAQSNLMRLAPVRLETTYLRGRIAIATAVAEPASAKARLAEARACATELSGDSVPWLRAIGALLSACTTAAAGDAAAAIRGYGEADERLMACSMRLHAHIARLARGELIGGGEGAAECAGEIAWMRDQAIANPARFSQLFAPRR